MASETSQTHLWRDSNGGIIGAESFLWLEINNVQPCPEDVGNVDVPLLDLHPTNVASPPSPTEDTTLLVTGASTIQPDDEPPLSINLENLLSLVMSPNPVLWPAAQFCEIALNPKSGLSPLLDAHVTHATSCHEPGVSGHHYVVLRIRSHAGDLTEIKSFWLRCQRKPGTYMSALQKLLKGNREIPAVDSVKLCSDERRVRNTADCFVSSSRFQNVQVKHLLSLLEIIHSVSASYGLLSHNSGWFSRIIVQTLDRLGDWDNRTTHGLWRTLSMALGSGTGKNTRKVAELFLEHWKTETFEPLSRQSSRSSTNRYSNLPSAGTTINEFPQSHVDPFIAFLGGVKEMMFPVEELCGLIRSGPLTRRGQIKCLVRYRRTRFVPHEFILLRINIPDVTEFSIRLERGPLTREGLFSRSQLNFPTNDMSRVSEMESRLVTEDLSRIAAIVEFDRPPTLDNLQRLLGIISEESKIYNVLKENCWFYATVIQDLLTDWCEGNLHGTLSHLTYGGEVRARVRARKEEIMGV